LLDSDGSASELQYHLLWAEDHRKVYLVHLPTPDGEHDGESELIALVRLIPFVAYNSASETD
jgi:hypothetical protein